MTLNFGLTRISVSFWFALSITIILIYDTGGSAGIAFFSALLHEAGHIVTFTLQKRRPKEIHFTPFGLTLREGKSVKLSYINEIQAALSGPLVNLCLFTLASIAILLIYASNSHMSLNIFTTQKFMAHGHMAYEYARKLLYINIALFVFNILPVSELDGGRALYAFIASKSNPELAKRIVVITSSTAVVILFAALFILAAYGMYNFSLFLAAFYLGILVLFRCTLCA